MKANPYGIFYLRNKRWNFLNDLWIRQVGECSSKIILSDVNCVKCIIEPFFINQVFITYISSIGLETLVNSRMKRCFLSIKDVPWVFNQLLHWKRYTFWNKLEGAWLKLKELHNLNIQIKWTILWQSSWTRYSKVGSICEIWAHRSQIWGQIIRTQTFTWGRICILVRKSNYWAFVLLDQSTYIENQSLNVHHIIFLLVYGRMYVQLGVQIWCQVPQINHPYQNSSHQSWK